jgi:outer membrane lipoprotein SlyB
MPVENSSDVLERIRVREVAGVFHSREAMEDTVEDLLLNGFDRTDIDRKAAEDEVRKRIQFYVAAEELADVGPVPRAAVFTRDDITVTLVACVSVVGAAAGLATGFGMINAGGSPLSAAILATLVGLGTGGIAGLMLARAFRREQVQGLEWIEDERGRILWVRVRSAEREAMAQEILRRHGGKAVRVHEIEIDKRTDDLPLSSLRPDPWLGSEQLGHP